MIPMHHISRLIPLLALTIAAGCIFVRGNEGLMAAPTAAIADEKIPEAYRGYWKWEGTKEKPLPVTYSAYVMEIYADPTACQLLKDKGVSLASGQGAQVKSEDKQVQIGFDRPEGKQTRTLILQPPEKDRITGKVVVIDKGKEVLNSEVVLVKINALP